MAVTKTPACRIKAICSSVPERVFDNLAENTAFDPKEVEKVVRLAGVQRRHVANDRICSSDLCASAARRVLDRLNWDPKSIDALIFVTQTQDYLLPSTSCLVQHWLGLSNSCACFDVGLGCSGYPYGMWLASMMLTTGGFKRVLMLHGETPTRFSDESDRSVALLFGDAGSATAMEAGNGEDSAPWWFSLHTDGSGWRDLLVEGGGFRNRFPRDARQNFVSMNGAGIFNFALKCVPTVVEETLAVSATDTASIDYFILHQSNLFIMRHLSQKMKIPPEKVPLSIQEFGSAGGPSVPLTLTQGKLNRPTDRSLRLLLVGYGVGLSWGSALISLAPDAVLDHVVVSEPYVS